VTLGDCQEGVFILPIHPFCKLEAIKSIIRKRIRNVREAVAAGDIEKADADFRLCAKQLDRAGQRNVIHRNAASRTKSRLQKLIKSAKA